MKTEYFEDFLALSEYRNYSVAAEHSFTTEPTLSRHIYALEKELHTELFIRNTRQVELTNAGKALIPVAQQILAMLNNYTHSIEINQGKLCIGYAHCLQQYNMSSLIFDFKKNVLDNSLGARPDRFDFSLVEAESDTLAKMLVNGECDFVMCYDSDVLNSDPKIQVRKILTDTYGVALSASHPLAVEPNISLIDLNGMGYISQAPSKSVSSFTMLLFKEYRYKPESITFAGETALELVSQNMGFTLLLQKRYAGKLPAGLAVIGLTPIVSKDFVLAYKRSALSSAGKSFLTYFEKFMSENGSSL